MFSPNKPASSGPEIMLKAMGFGEIIEAAKMFATKETMQKIMAFADNVHGLEKKVENICDRLDRIEAILSKEMTDARDVVSGSHASVATDVGVSERPNRQSPQEYRAA